MPRFLIALVVALLSSLSFVPIAGATFPGDNGPIVFSQLNGDFLDLHVINPDGSGDRQLTPTVDGYSNFDAAFDNGSDKVVYTQHNYNSDSTDSQIRIINTDGTGDHSISSVPFRNQSPSFSPDGTKVVFIKWDGGIDAFQQIYTMNVDGSNITPLTSSCCDDYPVYSPDGTKIAFFRGNELWLMNSDGSNQHLLASSAYSYPGRPSFSPDGSRVAFRSFPVEIPGGSIGGGIQSVAIDGTGRRLEVANGQEDFPFNPVYSPDATSLGYLFQESFLPSASGPPYTPSGIGMNITDLASGTSNLVTEAASSDASIDWGNRKIVPPPTPECKVRFSKARFFVFRNKPVYRMVARYWSNSPGRVTINFFARNEDGTKGDSLGSVSTTFNAEGRFRIKKTVSKSMAEKLRASKFGYLADVSIPAEPDYCDMAYSVEMSVLKHVKKQFVWFQPN